MRPIRRSYSYEYYLAFGSYGERVRSQSPRSKSAFVLHGRYAITLFNASTGLHKVTSSRMFVCPADDTTKESFNF